MHVLTNQMGIGSALRMLVALMGFVFTSAHIVQGSTATSTKISVQKQSSNTVALSVLPGIQRLDTIDNTSNQSKLTLDIQSASVRQQSGGTDIAWVVRYVHLSSEKLVPTVVSSSMQGRSISMGVAPYVDTRGNLVETELPSAALATAYYAGQSGAQHIVYVDVVVARSTSDTTVIAQRVDVTLQFAEEIAMRKSLGDRTQSSESYDRMTFVPITQTGLYSISAEELRANDLPTDASAAARVKVFGFGGLPLSEDIEQSELRTSLIEQPIIVRTNSDGSIRDVIFYGSAHQGFTATRRGIEHYQHPYDKRSGYLVTVGSTSGLRAQARSLPSGPVANRPRSAVGRTFFEEDVVNPYNDGSGRRWFGRSIESGGSMTVSTQLHGLLRQDSIVYVVAGAHRSDASPGVLSVSEQGKPVLQIPLIGIPRYMDMFVDRRLGSIPATDLQSDGRSVVRVSYSNNNRNSTGALDYLEIHYPRQLLAHDNEFSFWTDGSNEGITEWMINGFGGEMYGFDVTSPSKPVLLANASVTGGLYGLQADVLRTEPRQFFVSSNLREARGERITWLNLRTDLAESDVIVITHPDLRASANAFAEYRQQASSLTCTVVTTEQIFREFGYGVQDPTAIRDFLYYCNSRWSRKPRYVVLWGDGHFDYRNISTQQTNFVLTYQSDEPDANTQGTSTFVTDDYFVRVVGNDVFPDLPIGRLPVTSNDVGMGILEKIRHYENESAVDDWRTRLLLIADDGQTDPSEEGDGSLHLRQSEGLERQNIPEEMQSRKVYMVEYPTENVPRGRRKPGVTQDMITTINTSGALVVNWVGHGNPRLWAHEQIFVRETTIPQMTNKDKLFLLTAATCDFARFDMTSIQSGAEELLFSNNGGAIAVFSATRVVYAFQNDVINNEFYSQLFAREPDGRYARLGDALVRTKIRHSSINDQKFLLLGDPTMRLLAPDQRIVIDSVNNLPLSSSQVTIKALETVRVKGRIVGRLTSEDQPDGSFNGIATISLFDADLELNVRDTDKKQTLNTFSRRGPNLSRTSVAVREGQFDAEFVVPKDISFADLPGRIYGYAFSDDSRSAMGIAKPIFVSGIADASFDDDMGPNISIYLDSRRFQPGEFVRANPFLIVDLWDATGVNTTGVGIGHDIEANLNRGQSTEVLTNSYQTSLLDPKAGTASRQLYGLGPGLHHVRVRAWDVLNNVSQAETSFRILGDAGTAVTADVMAYPNPFSNTTVITFKHSFDAPFDLTMSIFTMDGRLVFSESRPMAAMQTAEFSWDARDTNGDILPSGTYHAVARCTSRDGSVSVVGGKLSLVR